MNKAYFQVRLGDICEYYTGRIATKLLDEKTYISTENMLAEKGGITVSSGLPTIAITPEYKKDNVLLSNIRPYFKKIWYAQNGGCSNDVLVLKVKENCFPKFLYYALSDDKFFDYSTATSKGTKMPRGDKAAIMQYSVPDIPYEEQRTIAATLSCLDDKIELNNRINANLEAQAQAIFKSWFVDFEPFQGGEFVDSELGKIPKGWNIHRLEDVFDFQEGPGIRNWQYVKQDGVNFINIRCIKKNDIDISTANMISKNEADTIYQHFMLKPWDIVISASGTLGRYAVVRKEHLPLCLNTSVIRFTPKKSFSYFSFMFGYITGEEFYNHLIVKATGSVQANFGPTHLKQIELIVPPKEIIEKYHSILLPLFTMQLECRKENEKLATIRDALLPRLMSGEIEVPTEEEL